MNKKKAESDKTKKERAELRGKIFLLIIFEIF